MDIKLYGKNVLVTGGSRGIGAQIVRTLAAAGANVGVHCRTHHDSVTAMTAELSAQYDVTVCEIVGDFADPASVAQVFDQFDERFSQIDMLINNAGTANISPLEELSLDEWQMMMQVDLTAPFQCAQMAALRMKESGSGVIINVQSMYDDVVRKGLSHYCVAKAALKMLTRAAGVEWGEHGIRVVGVSPGVIETDMNRGLLDQVGRHLYKTRVPMGHIGAEHDIADVVVFLCSEHARYITATTLYVDGGYSQSMLSSSASMNASA